MRPGDSAWCVMLNMIKGTLIRVPELQGANPGLYAYFTFIPGTAP